jgi:hypothetical protein
MTTHTLSTITGIDLELPSAAMLPADNGLAATTAPAHEHIAQAAYFIAQGRGFAAGADLDDWLAAERLMAQGQAA